MLCSSDIAEKPFIPNFDLEIWLWWVFRKIWPLPESYSLWCVDAKSVLKMIFASISSRITRDRLLKTRPTYFSPSLAATHVLFNSLIWTVKREVIFLAQRNVSFAVQHATLHSHCTELYFQWRTNIIQFDVFMLSLDTILRTYAWSFVRVFFQIKSI